MNNYEFKPGILIGGAAAVLSVLAAFAGLDLWLVSRSRQKFEKMDPQSRAVLPWLSPLLLPTLIILGLGIVAGLAKAYEEKTWPEPSLVGLLWAEFMILVFWLRLRKQT